ncbi:hypothetical protein GCM10023178_02190 [Actinomadura luteofluorescens]
MPYGKALAGMANDMAVQVTSSLTSTATVPTIVRVVADPETFSAVQISQAVLQWVKEAVERGMVDAEECADLVDVLVGELLIERSSLGSASARNVRQSPSNLGSQTSGRVEGRGWPEGSTGARVAPDRFPAVDAISAGQKHLMGEVASQLQSSPARVARLFSPDDSGAPPVGGPGTPSL